MTAKWAIDSYLFDNNPLYQKIPEVFKNLGIETHITRYDPLAETQDYGDFSYEDNVVLYGTIGYIKKCNKQFYPGAYGYNSNRICSEYMHHMPDGHLLNDDYIMIQFAEFKRSYLRFFAVFDTKTLFIRPNSGDKTFAGQCVSLETFVYDMQTMSLTSVVDGTIILISAPKELLSEARFIIADKQVITGSTYRWDDILDVRRDVVPEAVEMAKMVADQEWQMDEVYTCDIAVTHDGPKIIELNSFSCAGWYACDYKTIIETVTDLATKTYTY